MTDLVIAAGLVEQLERRLLAQIESCAVLFATQVKRKDDSVRLLVRKGIWPENSDYTRKGPLEVELSPDFVSRVVKMARLQNLSLIFVHSHPGKTPPTFSRIDDEGERRLAGLLAHRVPNRLHCAVVLSKGGWNARELGTAKSVRTISLGDRRTELTGSHTEAVSAEESFDRQVRAFGAAGQRTLSSLTVGIVGLGGTGSIVAEQLAHLGVGKFVLIDLDTLEPTNLNRVVGAGKDDVGRPKVDTARDQIFKINPRASVCALQADITRRSSARDLIDCDLIIGCTDSHGSRAVIQQVAYQYLIPCIDLGAVIVARDGKIEHIGGRVQLLTPGRGCFTCSELLNGEQVRRDLMNDQERRADPYIIGVREPAPAVISLNGTISSLCVSMVLKIFLGAPGTARHLIFNDITSTIRSVRVASQSNCYICSEIGSLARGDEWPLLARED